MSNTITSAISSTSSGGGTDVAAQIKNITQQISKLTKQLSKVSHSDLNAEQKQQQQEMLQAQIKMLEAQIAQLQQQQVAKATAKQETAAVATQAKVEGVNTKSDTNQVDIYI